MNTEASHERPDPATMNHSGQLARDARRELRRRRRQRLSYIGLAVLAAATILVVAVALQR
ncbi:hypothetical protein [Arthrobacter methylotrophus]|uniref:Peptidylprolyl isomerase n=2 Tax=Arthrobacter methylotrophus TaxID=121291 RepID=A0ABV5UR59_9MICC